MKAKTLRSASASAGLAALLACLALPAAARELVVAQVAPLSGPLAATGRDLMSGARLYFDQVNRHGGIQGNRIRLVTRDDGYRVADTLRLTREALEKDEPIALLGLVGTGNVDALLKEGVLDRAGVPVVGVRTGARSVRASGNPHLFHVRAGYDDETAKMVETLSTMGFSRFGVFYQNDPFGKEGLAGVETALAGRGLKPTVLASYEKNTTDVAAAVKSVLKADPQAVIMISNTLASAAFVKAAREADYQGQLLTVSVTDPAQVYEKIGETAAHGLVVSQVMPNPERREVPVVKEAARALEGSGANAPRLNYTMLEGYIYAKVLAEGLRGAGANPTSASLQAALARLRGYDVGGLVFDYAGGRREGARFVDLTIIGRGGKLLQ